MYSPDYKSNGVITVTFDDISLTSSNQIQREYRNQGFGVTSTGGIVPLGDATAMIQYTFPGTSQGTAIRNDQGQWAPSGADGSTAVRNDTNYLGVAVDKRAEIRRTDGAVFRSFGLNWGAAHAGNMVSFKRGGKLISSYVFDKKRALNNITDPTFLQVVNGANDILDDIQGSSNVVANWQNGHGFNNGQYNSYVTFAATNSEQYFDEIVLEQISDNGGRFESDNHSFKTVPEPGLALGLLAVGGVFIRQRRGKKSEASDA